MAERLHLWGLACCADRWGQRQAAGWLRRSQADVLVAEYGPLGAGIALACRLANIPLVVIFHGFDAYQHDTLERYRRPYSELFAAAAALVVVSEPMRQQLIQLGAPGERIQVNPCGVDPRRFCAAAPAASPPHFLAIGRFVGKKGPLLTIEAFARAHQVEPDCRLTMIGTGPLLADCQRRVAELGLHDVISFTGGCSHVTVQAKLRHVRAVVQHSLRCPSGDQEGTPVALIEAQMAGLPVVTTVHAGIPGVVIHGRTGFLVPEGDVPGMAEAMIWLAQSPQLAAEMGSAARTNALKHHTLERHIQALAATIHEAISRHQGLATG
ncbi:glycosyltransferase [Synechococcus sp. GFB01]|uniref:glycosyltransferase n=1 Tax=Synechococcus sp. GFB01 TaxID=1662190 RepID=UPI0013793392